MRSGRSDDQLEQWCQIKFTPVCVEAEQSPEIMHLLDSYTERVVQSRLYRSGGGICVVYVLL